MYPKEAVVFEVISQRYGGGSGKIKAGDHVEGAGPCCLGTERAWTCGILAINGAPTEEDFYQWKANLRPLTAAARAMYEKVRTVR